MMGGCGLSGRMKTSVVMEVLLSVAYLSDTLSLSVLVGGITHPGYILFPFYEPLRTTSLPSLPFHSLPLHCHI